MKFTPLLLCSAFLIGLSLIYIDYSRVLPIGLVSFNNSSATSSSYHLRNSDEDIFLFANSLERDSNVLTNVPTAVIDTKNNTYLQVVVHRESPNKTKNNSSNFKNFTEKKNSPTHKVAPQKKNIKSKSQDKQQSAQTEHRDNNSKRKNEKNNLKGIAAQGYSKPVNLSKYSLPTKEEIEKSYGAKVIIHGLGDQCKKFQDSVPGKYRYMAPAGLQNTGTNALYQLLRRNCYIPQRWRNSTSTPFTPENDELIDCVKPSCEDQNRKYDFKTGMRHMVPWWKHAPASWRDNPPYPIKALGKSHQYSNEYVLPIVLIKDPVYWMSSMCRNPYEVLLFHEKDKCPMLLVPEEVRQTMTGRKIPRVAPAFVFPPKAHGLYRYDYKSILHMWNEYYKEWMDYVHFPRLIIRYEDLLFHTKEVIEQVCHCGGGILRKDFQILEKSAKQHGTGVLQNKKSSASATASIIYGTKEIRNSILTKADKGFTRRNVDLDLMSRFNYSLP